MLTHYQFESYAAKSGLSRNALTFVESVRERELEASVDPRQRDNSIVYVISRKMGVSPSPGVKRITTFPRRSLSAFAPRYSTAHW